jgi:sodium-dependent dicarboxylate transporter 2/3/5
VLAVGLAASCAFMLPIATGPNAVIYGTGRVPQIEMIKAGFWLNVVATILILILLRLLCPLYGWV